MMNKTYNPNEIEKPLYEFWEQNGFFKPTNDPSKENYCIMIPPPNVTGSLHMGHAFQQTIMDILIRYNRMKGKNTLWQAGTDHAGIATQMVVERKLLIEQNKKRTEFSRDEFIDEIWKWKAESGNEISKQMRRLGDSVDWDRERFTMDDGLSNAVKEVFVRLYEENLIYRGKRLVNWDPKLRTAISDIEVENKDIKGSIWYIRYPLANNEKNIDGKNYLVVATTRPETMLGDTAVAVNPKDPRYQSLIGKFVNLPFTNRQIPIIADDHADMEKGTGCVKITPAHDFNDYDVGKRHQLPMINILNFDGFIRDFAEVFDSNGQISEIYSTDIPEEFRNLERTDARKQIILALEKNELLDEIKPHDLTIPYGDRSNVIIEPMLTDQWYVSTKTLAKQAIEVVKNGEIEFVPKQYENSYFSWMNDIQDWCISRQLWWGHRIPAWFDDAGNIYVGRNEEEIRKKHNIDKNIMLNQDNDVLDTWFSSALWTFSTLGWPENTNDLKQFHPTNVLVTGFDIIFFWVARMIMMTLHFVKDENGKPEIPFKYIYMTGLIRDEEGQKMSKSKGNVLDPIDMIDGISLNDLIAKRTSNMMQPQLAEKIRKRTEKSFPNGIEPHGTDAVRFTLAALASTGRDINWDMNRLEGYRNFCNKLWNASRFVLMNIKESEILQNKNYCAHFSLAEKWILTEFNLAVQTFNEAIESFRFDLAAQTVYDFVWNQLCDWYLELTKPILQKGNDEEKQAIRFNLLSILEKTLRLAHPIIPFITETIWQQIKSILKLEAKTIMLQEFPKINDSEINLDIQEKMNWIKNIIISVRNIRAENNIPPNKSLDLLIKTNSNSILQNLKENDRFLFSLINLSSIQIISENPNELCVSKLVNKTEIFVPIAGFIDKNTEILRLNKEIEKIQNEIIRIKAKLENPNFVKKAPESVIQKEQEKKNSCEDSLKKLNEQKVIVQNL